MKVGDIFIFDGPEQFILDENGLEYRLVGFHKLVKMNDTFKDKIHGKSWYLLDGKKKVDVTAGSYVETRCLDSPCVHCKKFYYNNGGGAECELGGYYHTCIKANFTFFEKKENNKEKTNDLDNN